MNKTLIIIPTYNEADNIVDLVDTLMELDTETHVLVVDDGNDGTEQIIRGKQTTEPRLHLIKRMSKSGRGTAVLEGLRFGLEKGYTYLVEMDADFSHNPSELPSLLAVAGPNCVVIGSRYLPQSRILNWPLKRRIFSKCANFYARVVLGIGITDYTNGFRVYGAEAAQQIDFERVQSKGYIVLSEVAYQLFVKGVVFREVPTIFVNRKRGASSFSLDEIREALFSVLRIRKQYGRKT